MNAITAVLLSLKAENISGLLQDEGKLSKLLEKIKVSAKTAESLPSPAASSSVAQQNRRRSLSSSLSHARGILTFGRAVNAKPADKQEAAADTKKKFFSLKS